MRKAQRKTGFGAGFGLQHCGMQSSTDVGRWRGLAWSCLPSRLDGCRRNVRSRSTNRLLPNLLIWRSLQPNLTTWLTLWPKLLACPPRVFAPKGQHCNEKGTSQKLGLQGEPCQEVGLQTPPCQKLGHQGSPDQQLSRLAKQSRCSISERWSSSAGPALTAALCHPLQQDLLA